MFSCFGKNAIKKTTNATKYGKTCYMTLDVSDLNPTRKSEKAGVRQLINNFDNRPFKITGRKEWLSVEDKSITAKLVVLDKMGDIHPLEVKPTFDCENLIVDSCDKNFVYYWIDSNIFINVKNIFLLAHPCEPQFFSRWYTIQKYYPTRTIPNIFLAYPYERYKNRWANNMENVNILNEDDVKFLRTKLEILQVESTI